MKAIKAVCEHCGREHDPFAPGGEWRICCRPECHDKAAAVQYAAVEARESAA